MDAPDLIYCIYEFNLILIGEVPLHWIYDEVSCLFLDIAECRTRFELNERVWESDVLHI